MSIRVSTSTMFTRAQSSMSTNQSKLLDVQQQLSSNKRILSPSDDPVGAARAFTLQSSSERTAQFVRNQDSARNLLDVQDANLSDAVDKLQNLRASLAQVNNASLNPADRESLAKDLEGQLAGLLSVANAQDESGQYLFSGFKAGTAPFAKTSTGFIYQGDTQVRELQVSPSRSMPLGFSGAYLFGDIPTGNQVFQTASQANNTGTGIISSGTVIDQSQWTGDSYTISFNPDGTFNVSDSVPTTLLSNQTFSSGQAISFAGISVSIEGQPTAGVDSFTVSPSVNQSVFTTVSNLVTALRQPVNPASATQQANLLSSNSVNIDQALDRLLEARSAVGSRSRELDELTGRDQAVGDVYDTEFSRLTDVDYVAASTEFAQRKLAVDAGQSTYVRISQMSLFNYLS